MSSSDRLSRTCFSTICWAQWPYSYPKPNLREKERDWERDFFYLFFKPNSILKAGAAASHDLNHFGVLSDHTKVAFALLIFAHLTFALLSHSHCCLYCTVGIRTSGFALVSFALLSFTLLSGYHFIPTSQLVYFRRFLAKNPFEKRPRRDFRQKSNF